MIDQAIRQHIEAAITKAEQGTRAEFVAAIARRADDYRGNALMAGMIAALLAGVAIWIFALWPGPAETLVAELLAFIVVYAVAAWTHLGLHFVPHHRKRHMAARLARLVFLERGLASTEERCGVLFFVSQSERYVEIIADGGIDQAVEPGAWRKIVDDFTAAIGKGAVEQGFVAAIEALGALLGRHYPPENGNPNRIPDRLIEL
ncbi:MAG TPA: TPM domain-containing protein [Dongiaceae bacterium]|jgi:putative membrane protein